MLVRMWLVRDEKEQVVVVQLLGGWEENGIALRWE